MIGKIQIKLILLMTAVNLVFACLVTNCPRGGKRGNLDSQSSYNINHSEVKKCMLYHPRKNIRLGINCSSEFSCKDMRLCLVQKFCCSEGFCKSKMCEWDVVKRKLRDLKPSSFILTKILNFNLKHQKELPSLEENSKFHGNNFILKLI